jgi:integrase
MVLLPPYRDAPLRPPDRTIQVSESSLGADETFTTIWPLPAASGRGADKGWTGVVARHGLHERTGKSVEPHNLNRHFKRLCREADRRRIRFHDLRHSCATLPYDQGVSIEHIQNALGHSSPTITKMIYVDATRKVQEMRVNKLGFPFDE